MGVYIEAKYRQRGIIVRLIKIMEVITCSKGGKKICLNGYMYTKKATKTNRIRWECSQRAAYDCKGALTTSLVVRDLCCKLDSSSLMFLVM